MNLNLKSNPNRTVYEIGRLPENDIVIADMAVSRKHGTITKNQEGLWLYEDHSSNGTILCPDGGAGCYVHNRTIALTPRCKLLMGMSTLEIET